MRQLLTLIILALLIGGALFMLSPEGRQTLDRMHINAMRAEHQARYRAGQPLAGTPDLARLDQRLAAQGVKLGDPVMLRLFKLESELEFGSRKTGTSSASPPIRSVSGRGGSGRNSRKATAKRPRASIPSPLSSSIRTAAGTELSISASPMCSTSPQGRYGSFIMVHGGCSSIGCYAMTDPVVDELWRFVTAALDAGQERVPVHVFPFRLTDGNLKSRKSSQWAGFWGDLKKGYDLFERTRLPPVVSLCNGRYAFAPGSPTTVGSAIEGRCPPEVADNS